jgi:MFS family permease
LATPVIQRPPTSDAEAKRPWYYLSTFSSFDFRPFRWYMGAMIFWNAAMSMQMLVRSYLIYDLTDSYAKLGIISLAGVLPMIIISPFGGVIADRTSRRLVLQLGQSFSIVITVVVAFLIFTDLITFWYLFAASIAQGSGMALVMPSRQSFLPEVVGLRRLMNAIPLQSAGMNLTQIIAPAFAGPLIDYTGTGAVYSIMAVMYAISVLMLFGVKSLTPEELEESRAGGIAGRGRDGPAPAAGAGTRLGVFNELAEGLRYISRDRIILSILSFSLISSVLGMPIRWLLAGYVSDIFSGEATELGLMQGAMGLGALAGALGLATLRMRHHRGLLLAGSAVITGIALIGFSAANTVVFGAIGLFVIGIGSSGRQAVSQVLVQEYVQDEYRGRVMSIYMMQFSIMNIGVFLAGIGMEMEAVGPQLAVRSLGIGLLVATAAYLAFVPRFRRLN